MHLDAALNFLVGEWKDEHRTGEPGTASDGGETWAVDLGDSVLIRSGWCEFPASEKRGAYRHEDLLIVYAEAEGEMHGIFWDNEGHVIHYRDANLLPEGTGIVLVSDRALPGPRQQLLYVFEPPDHLTATFSLLLPGSADFAPYLKWNARRTKAGPS